MRSCMSGSRFSLVVLGSVAVPSLRVRLPWLALLAALLALPHPYAEAAGPAPGVCGGTGGMYILSTQGFTVTTGGHSPTIPDSGYALGCYGTNPPVYFDYTPGVTLRLGTQVKECAGWPCPNSFPNPCAPDVADALSESMKCVCPNPALADGLRLIPTPLMPITAPELPPRWRVWFAITYSLEGPPHDSSIFFRIAKQGASPHRFSDRNWPIQGPGGPLVFFVDLEDGRHVVQLTAKQTMCSNPDLNEGETENYHVKLEMNQGQPRVKLWEFGQAEPL